MLPAAASPPAPPGLWQPCTMAAPPGSKHTAANKVQGNSTDQGHTAFQLPGYIKSTQCLAVWQKCSPCLWCTAPCTLFPATGGLTHRTHLALWIYRSQLRNVRMRHTMPRASCTRSLTKSMQVRPSGTSSTVVPTTPWEAEAALVWTGEE